MMSVVRRLIGFTDTKIPSVGDVRKYAVFMFPYVRRHWRAYVGMFAVMFYGVFYTVFYAGFLKNITEDAVHHRFDQVVHLVMLGLIVFCINILGGFLSSYLYTLANVNIRRNISEDLYRRLLELQLPSMTQFRSGDLVSRLTNDVETAVSAIGSNLVNLVRLPLTAGAAFIYLCRISPNLALISLAFGPFALLAAMLLRPLLRENGRQLQRQVGRIYSFLHESIAGYSIIRAFLLEGTFLQRYAAHNTEWVDMESKGALLRGYFRIGTQVVGALSFLTSVGIGAWYVAKGNISVGTLFAYVSLLQQVLSPFTGVSKQLGGLQRALAATERIQQIYSEPTEWTSPPQLFQRVESATSLRFENVSFAYEENQQVVRDVNLAVPAGKVVALVGPSGAGKSTLFRLVLGFYRSVTGSIYINGIASDRMSVSEIRDQIAYVPQDTHVFSGTIRENLLYGRPEATDNELIQAAIDANVHDFINSLPRGYDTEIGEQGIRLSGGQRQRIAIARAILKNSPILLLDEATSALDTATENLVQEALLRLMKDRTTMVIAHRLTTIHSADLIVVMDAGMIVESGNHHGLMRQGGLYARLYNLQFAEQTHALMV